MAMRNKIKICQNCENRFVGCHAYCKAYQKERAEYDEMCAERDRQKISGEVLEHGRKVHKAHLKALCKWKWG